VRQSTLQSADAWVGAQKDVVKLDAPTVQYSPKELANIEKRVDFFGDYVAFDKKKWRESPN
jgi:hypothetical protein